MNKPAKPGAMDAAKMSVEDSVGNPIPLEYDQGGTNGPPSALVKFLIRIGNLFRHRHPQPSKEQP